MWCFLFNYYWRNVVFLLQLLLGQCGVPCSIIVGVMWRFFFNYCWGNVVFLVQLLLG